MRAIPSFRHHTDNELASQLTLLTEQARYSVVDMISCLEEFDRRRLFLAMGFSSIYAYCDRRLQLREGAAYRRIEVARASRRCPELLEMVQDGRLSLATACLLAPRLGGDQTAALLRQAAFKSKRDVERLLATAYPQPPVPSVIRKLPEPRAFQAPVAVEQASERAHGVQSALTPTPVPTLSAPLSRRPIIAPTSAEQYKLQVSISAAAHDRLRQIQDLMRHRLPNGDPAAIVEHAFEVLHGELLKQKAAQVTKPRLGRNAADAKGRYIPASVRREVWRRDQGKCAFVAPDGNKCGSTSCVEFHHVQPYAVGGVASASNIEMRCRAHNGFEWERHLDQETMSLAGA